MGLELLRAATITRPADTTAYASGDLLANSTTAGSVTPFTFSGGATPYRVQRFWMRSSNNTITNKAYTLYLYSASPTVTNGDNGAFVVATNNATLLGVFGSGAAVNTGAESINAFYPLDAAGTFANGWLPMLVTGTFYGLIKVNAAYTPTSAETFDIAAEVLMESAA